jgi:CubicO group peptidase (beta-lactamase class C family)
MKTITGILQLIGFACLLGSTATLAATQSRTVALWMLPQSQGYVYQVPGDRSDGWRVSSLEAEGMDVDKISDVTNRIAGGHLKGIHSMLIVKNSAIVHEAYFGGYVVESLQTIYSITKSITSALIGIAIDKGFIGGVGETLAYLLPEYRDSIRDSRLGDVTLRDILTLTSGMDWDEKSHPYCDPRNSEYQQVQADDWVRYVMERPMRDVPGERYVYNTGSVHLLSAVIRSRTGMPANEFAERYLFGPLGIERYEWNTDPQGNPCTGGTHGGLQLTARDVARLGLLYLRSGMWNDRRVISQEWVDESTTPQMPAVGQTEIGYLWWRSSYRIARRMVDVIYSAGYGGQSLTLVPDLDLVFVLTCWGKAEDADIFLPMYMIIDAALMN